MTVERVESADDPRLAAYRTLPERTLRGENLFIAEGRLLVHRLLDSRFPVESVFAAQRYREEFEPRAEAARIPLYLGPESLLSETIGYQFHLGALAVGRRPPEGESESSDDFQTLLAKDRVRLVGCPDTNKRENLGMLFRCAAALGIDGLLLGTKGADPFSRRCLRTSMGSVLTFPFRRTPDFPRSIQTLRRDHGFQVVATVLDDSAGLLWEIDWAPKTLILFGNEYSGLTPEVLRECDRAVTVPMHNRTDSLNLAVCAGIVMYEMTRPVAYPSS